MSVKIKHNFLLVDVQILFDFYAQILQQIFHNLIYFSCTTTFSKFHMSTIPVSVNKTFNLGTSLENLFFELGILNSDKTLIRIFT